LSVLTTALGVGTIAAELFGVSFAVGAFFAGAVISESDLSHRAAADALPMQDAFAVLFFVSIGMLFDPTVVVRQPVHVLALVAVIVLWKGALTFGLVRALREPKATALLMAAGVGQIGELSFIVAELGVALGIVPREAQALIVAAALIAITVNGPILATAARLARTVAERDEPVALHLFELENHVVLVGYGRVGATVSDALLRASVQHVIVEEQERIVGDVRRRGLMAMRGDGSRADVLDRARISAARLLVVTAPEPFRARRIVEVARAANPRIVVAVRTHSASEQQYFENFLAAAPAGGRAVFTEREAAFSMAHYSLLALGRSDDEADVVIDSLRASKPAG
jgi:monovalent cation:H+ antiporter-2, CPA2 family